MSVYLILQIVYSLYGRGSPDQTAKSISYPRPLQDRLCRLGSPPTLALLAREGESLQALRLHLHTVPRLHGRDVVPVLDAGRVLKVLVQVVHVLKQTLLPAHHHVVDRAQMLRVLGQADAARVGDDRDAELAREQQDGQNLVDASDAAGVRLEDRQGARLQQLLEDDAVLAHLAGGHADGTIGGVFQRFPNRSVAEDVVGGGWLFDKPRLEFGELLHPFDGFGDGPDLEQCYYQSR
mgnify:CR=1 FL=1